MAESRAETIEKLNQMIRDIRMAMLTTVDRNQLRSRPMATQDTDFDGTLWFFTSNETHKVEEIKLDNRVSVSYAAPEDNCYVAMSGTAEIVDDREMMEKLWTPALLAWFPKGLDDPTLTLLRVDVGHAEYWDAVSSSLVEAFGLLKSLVTGERASGGEHASLAI